MIRRSLCWSSYQKHQQNVPLSKMTILQTFPQWHIQYMITVEMKDCGVLTYIGLNIPLGSGITPDCISNKVCDGNN